MPRRKKSLYFVDSILDHRQHNGQKYYLIKWQGYDNRDCTWEKPDKIPNLAQYIHEFEENVKLKGTNFYHIQGDEPPELEDFIGAPTQQKQSQLQDQQEQIKRLQEQVELLKKEITQIARNQEIMMQLLQDNQQQEKPSQPNQQQDSEMIDSVSYQSQKNTEVKEGEGGYEYGDQLDKIGQAAQIKQTGVKMYYLLWQKRPNGFIPKNRWVTSEYLQKYDIKNLCYYLQKKLQ